MPTKPEPNKCAVCGESADWRFYLVWLGHPYHADKDEVDFSEKHEFEGDALQVVYLCEEHVPCLDTDKAVQSIAERKKTTPA